MGGGTPSGDPARTLPTGILAVMLDAGVRVLDDPDPLFAELIAAVKASLLDLGHEASGSDAALTLAIGRPGRYRLAEARRDGPVVVWTGEPLPSRAARSHGGGAPGASARALRRVRRSLGPLIRGVPLPAALEDRRVAMTTARLVAANLDELRVADRVRARIVVTSRDRAARLADAGIASIAVPFGYHPQHAGPLATGGTRDHPLVMLGSPARHTRRARLAARMVESAGPDLLVCHAIWGDERAALLRRTAVVVDVHRVPGNFVGLRLLLGIAAGAVVVTEPMTDPYPFAPGVHYVEAVESDLLRVARSLVGDDARRLAIVEAGQRLLATELTMERSVARVIGSTGDLDEMGGVGEPSG